MTDLTQDINLTQAAILLSRYKFEMKGYTSLELIEKWLKRYPPHWIRVAIIEALYQGRYKAISVEQILELWLRRRIVTCHFTHEFERLICRNLPYPAGMQPPTTPEVLTIPPQQESIILSKFDVQATGPQETKDIPNGNNDQTPEVLTPPNQESEQIHQEGAENLSLSANYSLYVSSSPKEKLTNLDELFAQFFNGVDTPSPPVSVDTDGRSRQCLSGKSIHEFTPLLDRSELYSKLKAVVKRGMEENNP